MPRCNISRAARNKVERLGLFTIFKIGIIGLIYFHYFYVYCKVEKQGLGDAILLTY